MSATASPPEPLPLPPSKPPSSPSHQQTGPSSPYPSSSRKRLLTDLKPKPQQSEQVIQKSANSSPTSPHQSLAPPQQLKKTRDLPNLSDCHCCGVRINHTNPKDRLQALESVWRIVLLCKKCTHLIHTGQRCPYCLKNADDVDTVKCRVCERKIHIDCVFEYKSSPPWSYSYNEIDFKSGFNNLVCVDCWVPKLLKNSISIHRKKRKKKNGNDENVTQEKQGLGKGGIKGLEKVVNGAKVLVERKVVLALEARANAFRKVEVAKSVLQLASSALGLAEVKDKSQEVKKSDGLARCSSGVSGNSGSEDTYGTRVLDDAELAFKLHREMNSSRRILRNTSLCTMNTVCLDVPDVDALNGELGIYDDGGGAKANIMLNEKLDRSTSVPSVCFTGSKSGCGSAFLGSNIGLKTYKRRFKGRSPGIDAVREKLGLVTYKRRRKESQQDGDDFGKLVGVIGACDSADGNKMVIKPSFHEEDVPEQELFSNEGGNEGEVKRDGEFTMPYKSCNKVSDRYIIKYSKRPRGSKIDTNDENVGDAFHIGNPVSSPEKPLNCSAESRRSSDASFGSCVVNLQGSACISGSSREET